ncbi:hypothetical protein ASPVEDRAFT_35797 [Aspergillus versicolor CBS 583.65]|uniref:Uncharacterized protein n=1 Tax=Aspergillus versicolor CBS 583.65 TaxID=1036611 RepID=A0A1L9P4R4_ASPVE|nr:uncharacterized protein ASPVEDRAFT_35797 [Aspergillus versicolor CBS 583.65]OJI96403.1 hypothetical protein ASPVEDRAFT_35797 [Aspergillus versicolor CBS 583.65]
MCYEKYVLNKFKCGATTKTVREECACKKPRSAACKKERKEKSYCVGTTENPKCGTCHTCQCEKLEKSVDTSMKRKTDLKRGGKKDRRP